MSKSLSELASNADYQNWVRQEKLSTDYHNISFLAEYYNFVNKK